MTTIFKPMLATDYDPEKLRFPCWASYKLDGLRAVVRDGVVYSRSNKPIPNKHVQAKFKHLEYFDGELIVGDPTDKECFRNSTSVVMSHDKPADDVRFYAFDHIGTMSDMYFRRLDRLYEIDSDVFIVHQQSICTQDELVKYEAEALEAGYEGLILRDSSAPYKNGRSTVNEGYLLKVKQFKDAEAVVIGFEERMANNNEAVISELGRTKRSSHKAGKSGRGDLGAIMCQGDGEILFNIGTGFSDSEREHIWANQSDYLGRIAKYKYFPVGVKEAPRHPVFLGWRDVRDM